MLVVENVRTAGKKGVISDNALQILKDRYLEPDETVDHMFHRVAGGDQRFEDLMVSLKFLPNSPTLMNAGTIHEGRSTFSACFKFDVADSMLEGDSSIIETSRKAAAVAKWGGGVGYYLGDIRKKGAVIRSVHRVACGPIACLRYYNMLGISLITQGGRRELAQMAILPWDHDDIREFIHVKDENPQELKTFNISVSATDAFMERATVFPGSKENELWLEICDSAWRTGDPGFYFYDTSERTNPTPHLGHLTGTNPCGEVPMLADEACNLGSIHLGMFVTPNREVDWGTLEEVVVIATRFLDQILDRNHFPHPAITKAVALTRKLGLGVMGWADMLALMHIQYDTNKAVELGRSMMKFINEVARDTSIKLAKENNGPYPGSDGDPCRNATRTCLAPCGTIAIIANAGGGFEPFFALEWERKLHAGHEREKVIQERIPCWDRLEGFIPKTTHEIGWRWHVKHQAAFQAHTDLACSKTINMPNSAPKEDVRDAYTFMWKSGCKGGTIFRDGCRSGGEQVLNAKESGNKKSFVGNGKPSENGSPNSHIGRRKPPDTRKGVIHKMQIGEFEGYLHAGMYEDDSLAEIFVTCSKEGSTVAGLLDGWAKMVSWHLQDGKSLSKLVESFSGTRFEPMGLTKCKEVPVCTSIQDYIVRWLDKHFGKGKFDPDYKGERMSTGHVCPDCGNETIFQGGCLTCVNGCGWSKCG